jgi:hypothetical protein
LLNNFISGGQIFLHKVRMLRQVFATTIFVSMVVGFCLTWNFSLNKDMRVNWDGAITFAKAKAL